MDPRVVKPQCSVPKAMAGCCDRVDVGLWGTSVAIMQVCEFDTFGVHVGKIRMCMLRHDGSAPSLILRAIAARSCLRQRLVLAC